MRFGLSVFAVLLCGIFARAADPVVSNVRASQRAGTKLVDVWYDVRDADGERLSVSVAVSVNGSAITSSSFSGVIGSGVVPGSGRRIVWDAGADWGGEFSENVTFAVTAEDAGGDTPFGMVRIPGGTNSGTDPDYGAYSLTVSTFYMDATEVTKAQWDEVYSWAVSHGYSFRNAGQGKGANHPVHTVNWYDCVKWCNARSEREGRSPCYRVGGSVYRSGESSPDCNFGAGGYRLPTNDEWEYAARGGAHSRRFPWGANINHNYANYCANGSAYSYDTSSYSSYTFHPDYDSGGYPYTSPVGRFSPNGYGLYDMAGNVWEWCNDTSGSYRSFRGGSWSSYADYCRVAYRYWHNAFLECYDVGVRAVCR